ncbi:MAG: hypothetical protein ACMUHX_11655 [bacterium]
MASQKDYPFIRTSLKIFLAASLFLFLLSLGYYPFSAWGQGRSLGFKGLVPPGKSEKKMYKGKVTLVDLPLIKIKTNVWSSPKVFVGPPGFLNKQGFSIRNGQHLIVWAVPVKVEGSEVLAAFEIQDMDTGRKVLLRNENGEPVWWGDNKRSGQGGNSR